MTFVLVLLIGTQGIRGVSLATVPGFADRSQCESAGESWKLEAKAEYYVRYYCITGQPQSQQR